MRHHLLTLATAIGLVSTLGACSLNQITNAVTNALGQLGGTIYAPQAQVAVIASGAGNVVSQGAGNVVGPGSGSSFQLLSVRSDEVGVPNATVRLLSAADGSTAATVVTDPSGKFAANVSGGVLFHVQSTFSGKDGGSITVNGFAEIDPTSPLQLGVAHNMVASKLLATGVTKPAYDAFKLAVAAMENDLQAVANTPAPTTQDEAAAGFDANASATTKTLLAAVKNQ